MSDPDEMTENEIQIAMEWWGEKLADREFLGKSPIEVAKQFTGVLNTTETITVAPGLLPWQKMLLDNPEKTAEAFRRLDYRPRPDAVGPDLVIDRPRPQPVRDIDGTWVLWFGATVRKYVLADSYEGRGLETYPVSVLR